MERPDLMLWYLWSRGGDDIPQGVYRHETSLSLHELSDANPSQLHMTVPISFRRTAEIPRVPVCCIDRMSHANIPKRFLGCFARPHSARFMVWRRTAQIGFNSPPIMTS